MLLASGMEKKFWAEAAATAVKLINMCPSSSINGDTPNYRWYGRYGDYSHLRTFGCKAFAHLKQSKLDARAVRCVMLGYQSGVKGYRLWCIEQGRQKVMLTRDVVFIENEMPFKKSEKELDTSFNAGGNSGPEVEVELGPEIQSGDGAETDDDLISNDEVQGGAESSDTPGGDTNNHNDLRDYKLARDRVRRKDVRPQPGTWIQKCCILLCVWLSKFSTLSLVHIKQQWSVVKEITG